MEGLKLNFVGIKSGNLKKFGKKKQIFVCFLLTSLFSFLLINAQKTQSVPQSEIINTAQLLNDLKTLSADDMEGRLVGSPGSAKAREYIVKRFKESGLKSFTDSYIQPIEFSSGSSNKKIKGANVVGYIKGNQTPEKYIVITAHYDHLGIRGGKIFNGADDNASGVAALFALGEYFTKHPPANSLIFVAFDAEEGSGAGGRTFVAESPVKKESIVMNINMDMISHSDANELYASGTYHYPFLKPYLEKFVKTSSVKLLFGHDQPNPQQDDWTTQSDHHHFHKAKIPYIYFGVEDHKDYHKETDEFETITQEFYVHAVETIIAAVKEFDVNLAQIEKQKAR